jgi:hypothetical protein
MRDRWFLAIVLALINVAFFVFGYHTASGALPWE